MVLVWQEAVQSSSVANGPAHCEFTSVGSQTADGLPWTQVSQLKSVPTLAHHQPHVVLVVLVLLVVVGGGVVLVSDVELVLLLVVVVGGGVVVVVLGVQADVHESALV